MAKYLYVYHDDSEPSYRPIRVVLCDPGLMPLNVTPALGPFGPLEWDALLREVEQEYGTTAAEYAVAQAERLQVFA